MSLIQYNPWPTLDTLRRDLETGFGPRSLNAPPLWQPQVDILEFKDRYELHADLPGVDPSSVDIQLEDGVLTLAGERTVERPVEDGAERIRRETAAGRFERRFHLPRTVVAADVSATARHGVLVIHIPKESAAQPIKVQVAA